MVKAVIRRLIVGGALVVAAFAAIAPKASWAQPGPTEVTITGAGLDEPVSLTAESDPERFTAIIDQVNWLTGAGHPASKTDALGPKYTVVVLVNGIATQTYDLYPLAQGGPRAFRPATQPDQRKTTNAWFFGRLNMSEALRAAGAPLPEQRDVLSGGIGGGSRMIPDDGIGAREQIDGVLTDLRRLVLLDGAILLTIAAGLAGIALMVRRRTR